MPEETRKFRTDCTSRFRATDLGEQDARTIANIEKSGCEVIHVKGDTAGPGWSYTIGINDTGGAAEIIQVGLKEKTAHFFLNEAATELRSGVNLRVGRHRLMIGDVECEFRPTDSQEFAAA